jgi:hypothetical protein
VDRQRSVDRGGPLREPAQPATARSTGVEGGAAMAVVGDDDAQARTDAVDADLGSIRRRSASVAATTSARLRASDSTRRNNSSVRLAPRSCRAALSSTRATPRATHGAATSRAGASATTARSTPDHRPFQATVA